MSLVSVFTAVRYNIKHTGTVWLAFRRNYSQQTASDDAHDKYEDDIRHKILQASLPFVASKGWSKEALACGAEAVGYPGVAHGIFSKGGADLIDHFQRTSNGQLVEYMKKEAANAEKLVPPAEFVEDAVKLRLQMIVPYLSRWPQAIAIMSLPPNVPTALASQLTMVDDICFYAGDRSVDFSWYARRLALGMIYKATELYLIQDKSPDFNESWKFLNNRLTEAVQLQNLFIGANSTNRRGTETLMSAFITARNILGLNSR